MTPAKNQSLTLIQKSEVLLTRHRQLRESGWKQKEIAARIGLRPSAYSNLVNKVLPRLVSETQPSPKHFTTTFKTVNNLSEITFRKDIDKYLAGLQELTNAAKKASQSNNFITDLQRETPCQLLKKLAGTYHCYYISSFGYRIKREPFKIYHNESGNGLHGLKGNILSSSRYEGFAYMSNPQILTFHLQEQDVLIPDHFIIHFSLPPLYDSSINMLRGISTSMSNGYQPISRQIILQKIPDEFNVTPFLEMTTEFYERTDDYAHPILNYLSKSKGYLELVSTPRPSYNVEDLQIPMDLQEE